jgi:hypothetical protein
MALVFIITGAIGFGWVALWSAVVSTPEKTRCCRSTR